MELIAISAKHCAVLTVVVCAVSVFLLYVMPYVRRKRKGTPTSVFISFKSDPDESIAVVCKRELRKKGVDCTLITAKSACPYERNTGKNPSWFKKEEVLKKGFLGFGRKTRSHTDPLNPVETVSWSDAVEFCRILNEHKKSASAIPDGYEYRLPSEAEWEYASRGGNKSRNFQYSGSDTASEVAWFQDNSNDRIHGVGRKKANEIGIHDMSGNVWEWCHDWYHVEYYSHSPGTNPVNNDNPSVSDSIGSRIPLRVARGGCWNYTAAELSCGRRCSAPPFMCDDKFGFRVCLGHRIKV